MSILIKDMDMPKVCNECPFCCNPSYFEYAWCELLQQHFDMDESYNKVADFCPITEVPTPHGRLGDLDKLMAEFMDSDLDHLQRDDWKEVIQIVADAPTVIEAEGKENDTH